MAGTLGAKYVMDIQLLPFCPINYLSVDGNSIDVSGLSAGTDYTFSAKERSIVFYCRSCDREFYIDNPIAAASNKTTYLTKKYRLCSNNFSASFDVPVYENQGIDKFHVKMTCLPYSPWINIHINYKGLNGIDIDDAKGLTLGGSFGLSMTSNSWTEYVYNNSNYSQLFETQLEYQKYQQKMNMISSGISSGASAIGSGVGVGALLGGPVGIAAGIATGVASAGAGIADLAIQNKLNQASNEYSRTQYNLQLGNIKAKPSTLSRITAFNCSTKQFPYLEVYECTPTEQEQVENWLKANGQTIGAVGRIADYVKSGSDETFVKAGIVRFNSNIAKQCDASIVAGINSELSQGIYIRGDDI